MSTHRFHGCIRVAQVVADIVVDILNQLLVDCSQHEVAVVELLLLDHFARRLRHRSRALHEIQEVLESQVEHVDIEWLGDILIRTAHQSLLAMLIGKTGRQHHEWNGSGLIVLLHLPAEFIAIHHRHHHIAEDDIRTMVDDLVPGILTVHGLNHGIIGKQVVHELAALY